MVNRISWPSLVRRSKPVTCVSPVESMWVRTPSSGEAGTAAPGVPFAGALIEAEPTGPGVAYWGLHARHDHRNRDGEPRGQRRRAAAHAGPTPVPLLPGLTAGSPAAHRGQVASPGS